MRIAIVLSSLGQGGLERHVVDLAHALSDKHQVFVVADAGFAGKLRAPVVHIPFSARFWRLNPFALWQLRRILQTIRPDVIHAQANKAAAMCRAARVSAPVRVATVHNIKSNVRAFAGYDGIIAVSKATAQQLPYPCVTVIPNGIEPLAPMAEQTVSALRQQWCPDGAPLTVAIGRLVHAKGFDVLLRAWQDLPGTLLIVGAGPDEHKLKALQTQLGLRNRVVFTGFRHDVMALMAAADLLVISSRREGFPYVLVEALHVGVPVVSTRIPGAADFLPADAVVATEDVAALHAVLRSKLQQHELLREQYKPWFDRARSQLTLAHMTEETERFYQSLC